MFSEGWGLLVGHVRGHRLGHTRRILTWPWTYGLGLLVRPFLACYRPERSIWRRLGESANQQPARQYDGAALADPTLVLRITPHDYRD